MRISLLNKDGSFRFCQNNQGSNLFWFWAVETARYMLNHHDIDTKLEKHVPALIHCVKNRFGQIKHFGATRQIS